MINKAKKKYCFMGSRHSEKVGREVLEGRIYTLSKEAVPRSFFRQIDTVVDVGANCGMFSLRARDEFPNARIVAIEPNRSILPALQTNLMGLKKVTLVPYGLVPSGGGQRILFDGRDSPAQGSLIQNKMSKRGARTIVEVIDFSALESLYRIRKIDVIKLDVEGLELDLLRALFRQGVYSPKVIFLEFHSVDDRIRIDALLGNRGYVLIEGMIKYPNRGDLTYVREDVMRTTFFKDYAIKGRVMRV